MILGSENENKNENVNEKKNASTPQLRVGV